MTQHGKDSSGASSGSTYRGEVAYIFAFDLAYDMRREPMATLLGRPARQFVLGPTRHGPRQLLFFLPQMVDLPPLERFTPAGSVKVSRTVKLFPVGAVSITVRVPFEVERLDDLCEYHNLCFTSGPLEEEVRELAERLLEELRPLCVKPVDKLPRAEAYTVFCMSRPPLEAGSPRVSAEAWLKKERRRIAALLVEEPNPENLARQKIEETTGLYLTYYDDDLLVIDWDAALMVERPRNFDEILHIMELANVQLAELRAYDVILDTSLEKSYRDLTGRGRRGGRDLMNQLREIRVDLARLSDELSNITKFFGDWHLARLYQHLYTRFHLADWTRIIAQKLRTLDELYAILKQDQTNRWMMILEATIVLLFIIDVIIILMGVGGR